MSVPDAITTCTDRNLQYAPPLLTYPTNRPTPLTIPAPAVFHKLRTTILETFGPYDDPRNLTFASLKACQYLQHTMSEVLRLYSIVPANSRRALRPTTLPRGGGPDGLSPIAVPAEMQVDYSIHVMQRRKDLWGEDADEFRPERFQGRKSGWEFLPVSCCPMSSVRNAL